MQERNYYYTDITHEKIFYIKLALTVSAFFLLLFTIINFFYMNKPLLAGIDFTELLIMLYLLFSLRKDQQKVLHIFVLNLFILFILILNFVSIHSYGLVWVIFLPINAYFLLDTKRATWYSLIYFFYFVYFIYFAKANELDIISQITLSSTYILVTVASYLFAKNSSILLQSQHKFVAMLHEQNMVLERYAKTDTLTQLYNRLEIDKILGDFIKNREIDLSILFLDIDHFKFVNDTYGHQAGDAILKQFAKLLQYSFRKTDILGRWGGEEFIVILPNTALKEAKELAERFRQKVQSHDFGYNFSNSCSIGVATLHESDSVESLVERADRALYYAKEHGRDRVATEEML